MTSLNSIAETVLSCNANNKCDAYLKNCNADPYAFTVLIDPKKKSVTLGRLPIKADFTNQTVVDFEYLEYKVSINRLDYSATLFNNDGQSVRYGFCNKTTPAW